MHGAFPPNSILTSFLGSQLFFPSRGNFTWNSNLKPSEGWIVHGAVAVVGAGVVLGRWGMPQQASP